MRLTPKVTGTHTREATRDVGSIKPATLPKVLCSPEGFSLTLSGSI